MARFLDVDGFADRLGALQAEIRDDRRIASPVADGLCAQLGGVLRQVRTGLGVSAGSRVDPGLDEAARQARLMGGADPFGRVTR